MYPDISDIEKNLTAHVFKTWGRFTKRPPQETASALLSWERAYEFYDEMIKFTGSLKGKKLLEIGCGYCLFLAICLKKGIKAEGIEPAKQEFYKPTFKIGQEILKRSGFSKKFIRKADGEKLPYKDNTFDVVASFHTLEHVQDVEKVIIESVRVLKPGGYFYSVIPNYGSFWESHFGILWIPYLPKVLAKYYVRLWGKLPKLIDEYQFVNQLALERYTKNLPIKVLDWGNDLFAKKAESLTISRGTLDSARKILEFLNRIKVLTLAVNLACLFKAQTPIVLVAKKLDLKQP